MKFKSLSYPEKWIFVGIPVMFCIGTIMHFAYEVLWENQIIGLFFPINESVWEHSKMVLLPIILWWTLYYFAKGRTYSIDKNRWFTSALVSLLTALTTIPMVYYFYTQAFGVELMWVDIGILLLALIAGQLLGWHFYRHGFAINSVVVMFLFTVLVLMFMLFTYFPPNIPIFFSKV